MTVIIWEWDKNRATHSVEINDPNKKTFAVINLMFFYPGSNMDDTLVLVGENNQKNHVMK